MDRVPPRPTTPAGAAAPRGEPTGSGAWSLVDILIARQDWEGARTFLERLHAQSPEAARPRLIEVLLAQARASADEDAQLDLYQRVHLMDEASAEARAGVERIAKARADRALCEVPEISLASRDRKAAPPPSPVATASQPPPAIEVRDPGTDAAIRRAREAEHEARTKAEAQVASLAAERERLLEEARAADAERDRLGTLLRASVADYDRLSADLEIARTSQAGPPPARLRSRAARRALRVASALALLGAAALAALYATRPSELVVDTPPVTLLDRTETAQVSATRVLRIGTRRPAAGATWSSRDPAVATVDAQGVVVPAGTGSTRIEARDGALVAGVDVTVSLPARIALDPAEVTLTPERPEAAILAVIVDGAGAPWKKRAELAWASSAPGVAVVEGGKVRRVGIGEAVLTASLGELRATLVARAIDQRTALEQGCEAGGLDACVDLGKLVEDGGAAGEERALDLYEKACAAGALRGCVALGERRESGRGGAQDVAAALAAYRKACEGGHAPGCTHLGHLYETTVRDAGKALSAYRTACDAGDLDGCWHLGTMYELGHGVARDAAAAADLYKKACDGGAPEACTSLAHMRWNGSGAVPRDEAQAIALFEKACDARGAEACIFMALKYKAGEGVTLDPRKAAAFFGKACAAGHKGSCVIAQQSPDR